MRDHSDPRDHHGGPARPASPPPVAAAKAALRGRLLAARAGRTDEPGRIASGSGPADPTHSGAVAAGLARYGLWLSQQVAEGTVRTPGPGAPGADPPPHRSTPTSPAAGHPFTVAVYVSTPLEPATGLLRQTLRDHGVRVLLPVVTRSGPTSPTALRWAVDPGDDGLVTGPYGIRQPSDDGADEGRLSDARLVLLPALAVDRTGTRLGRGGGYYDRSLRTANPRAILVAVVNPDEVLDQLPAEPHDHRVHGALTREGVTWLGNRSGLPYR